MKAEAAIIHHVFEKRGLAQVEEDELMEMLHQYPYFAHLHWFLAKKREDDKESLRKAGLFTYYPISLQYYLLNPDTAVRHGETEKESEDRGKPTFQPLYTEDYFAYTRTSLPEHIENEKPPTMEQVKSFTGWLKMMKKPTGVEEPETEETSFPLDQKDNQSREEEHVITESMAEIWVKNKQFGKAIEIYEKLILLNPEKRSYFANKISALKEQ